MISRVRIAHISDAHLLEVRAEPRSIGEHARLLYLSLLRPRLAEPRIQRLRGALAEARARGFDHLVFTGDLTEEGSPAQFELLAHILSDSGIPKHKVTLVPGNHDVYDTGDGWPRALNGPLADYSATSSSPVLLGETVIAAVNTAIHQHWLLSYGTATGLAELEATIEAAAQAGRNVLLVQHHPPIAYHFAPAQQVDGLRNCSDLQAMMKLESVLAVLHGHLHQTIDARTDWLGPRHPCNVFCAPAVVSAKGSPVRYYDVHAGHLTPMDTN